MNSKYIEEVVKRLKQKGVQEKEINGILDEIMKTATDKIYENLEAALTEEDKKRIEEEKDDYAAFMLALRLYKDRTGKDAEKFMDEFMPGFINDYFSTS